MCIWKSLLCEDKPTLQHNPSSNFWALLVIFALLVSSGMFASQLCDQAYATRVLNLDEKYSHTIRFA